MEWWSDGVIGFRSNTPILQYSNAPILHPHEIHFQLAKGVRDAQGRA